MRKLAFTLFIFLNATTSFAQNWTEEEVSERLNYGLKMGMSVSGIYGTELKNPVPMPGVHAGLFWHSKPRNDKKIGYQTGIEARLRGSNFDNGDLGNSAYTKIGLISLDVPLILNMNIGKVEEKKYKVAQIGIVPGYFLKTIMYSGPDRIPVQRDNYLKTWDKLPLKPIDLQAVIGYQYRGNSAGYQAQLKVGVLNLNDNFSLPELLPATGTGGTIMTWNLEFSIVF